MRSFARGMIRSIPDGACLRLLRVLQDNRQHQVGISLHICRSTGLLFPRRLEQLRLNIQRSKQRKDTERRKQRCHAFP